MLALEVALATQCFQCLTDGHAARFGLADQVVPEGSLSPRLRSNDSPAAKEG
jgi:hypothetical protein